MNDPHVAALLYCIEHSPTFDYEKARPCECELPANVPDFQIRIESDQATVKPKHHFATAEEARAVVEPYLRAWELDAALKNDNPDALRFVYVRPEILDRNPTPGVAHIQGMSLNFSIGKVTPRLGFSEYPAPPSGLAVGFEVTAMFDRWSRYKAGQALLGDTADFCRGALEKGGGRQAAAEHYGIDRLVMNQLGDLAHRKGGPHARKYKGYCTPYTGSERAWLEAALKKLIRRAAEVAHDPDATRTLITMDDLPSL
jgi:hypothetical protein